MKGSNPLIKFLKFGAFPLSIFLAVLTLPLLLGTFFTFTNWDGFGLDFEEFVGVANYVEALQDEAYWASLQFTAMYVIVSLVLVNLVAFGLALLVTAGLRSANVFRTFFFIPNLIWGVILGFIWQFVFNRTLTTIGKNFEIPFLETSWLNAPESAFWALVLVTVWQMSG